ncbi:flagellar hook capping protein [bacterium]|nr:flagellar hook capping protein [bacterium]
MSPVNSVYFPNMNPSPSSQMPNLGDVEEKQDFLKLLVAQMRHQDPMSPMEGTEFASQLAQFSSLEELQNLGQKLENSLQADMLLAQSINNTMAATLIGKNVNAAVNNVHFKGEEDTEISFELTTRSKEVTIDILDENGLTLRTIKTKGMDEGVNNVAWNGTDDRGNLVPLGDYSVVISAQISDHSSIPVQPVVSGRVSGVRYIDGSPMLKVNGMDIPFGAVLSIMEGNPAQDEEENAISRLIRSIRQ